MITEWANDKVRIQRHLAMGDLTTRKTPVEGRRYERITDQFNNENDWLKKFEEMTLLQIN